MAPAMASTSSDRSGSSEGTIKLRVYSFSTEEGQLVLQENLRLRGVSDKISYADLVHQLNEKCGTAFSIKYHAPTEPHPSPLEPFVGANLTDVKDDEGVQNMIDDFYDSLPDDPKERKTKQLLLYLIPADTQGMTEEEWNDCMLFMETLPFSKSPPGQGQTHEGGARLTGERGARAGSAGGASGNQPGEYPCMRLDQFMQQSERDEGSSSGDSGHGEDTHTDLDMYGNRAQPEGDSSGNLAAMEMGEPADPALAATALAVMAQPLNAVTSPRTQDSYFCDESLKESFFRETGRGTAGGLPSHISVFGDGHSDINLPQHISAFGPMDSAYAAIGMGSGRRHLVDLGFSNGLEHNGPSGEDGGVNVVLGAGSVMGGFMEKSGSDQGLLELEVLGRDIQRVPKDDIKVLGAIGEGAFGEVSLATCSVFGKVAVKWLKPEKVERHSESFWREANLLARLNHPNVLRFYGIVTEAPPPSKQVVGIVTEFVPNGSLTQLLRQQALAHQGRPLSLRERAQLALGAVNGLAYLHALKTVHFDLKPDNLLVDGSGEIKVADFGLSKSRYQNYVSGVRDLRGTLPYMAPELLSDPDHVNEKADVWSMGMVLWEMLTMEVPFSRLSPQHIIAGLMKGNLQLEVPDHCEPEWRGLMERCWEVNPASRPAFRDCAAHLEAILEQCDRDAHAAAAQHYLA